MDTSAPRPAFASRSLRRRWKIIVATILMGLLAAAGYLISYQPQYQSTSVIFLEPMTGNPYSPSTPDSRTEQLAALTTEAGLVHTDRVIGLASGIVKSKGGKFSDNTAEQLTTEVPSNTQVINIHYSADTPEQAQLGAQALAEAYLQYRQERASRALDAQSGRWDQQISSISEMLDEATAALKQARDAAEPRETEILKLEEQIQIYSGQLAQVRVERTDAVAASGSPGDIINPASLPKSPTGISPWLIACGLILGAGATGVLLALLLEHLDKRIRAADDIAAAGLEPVFGEVTPWQAGSYSSDQLEEYRLLRDGLYASTGYPHSTVLLTGVIAGSSSDRISSGLATALAQSDISTIVVQADPESVLQHDVTGPGLTDLLSGDYELESTGSLLHTVGNGPRILGIGSNPGNLTSLVQGPRLETVIESLALETHVLLIAGPPAYTSMAAAIAKQCSKVLVVAPVNKSTAADIVISLDAMQRQPTPVVGAVIERKPSRRSQAGGTSVPASAEPLPTQQHEPHTTGSGPRTEEHSNA